MVKKQNYNFALTVLISLFFMWGFITCLNDILIPHLKNLFELNYTKAMLIQFCFFTAYFVMSMPSGYFVEKFGYKKGIVTGLSGAGIGCLLFYPAAEFKSYYLFLFAFFVLASGITLLQVAANPFVAILGKPETASSRLTLSQAFNSLGTTLAPLFGSILILASTAEKAEAVQVPYIGLAIALFVIAGVFAVVKLPNIAGLGIENRKEVEHLNSENKNDSIYKNKGLMLGSLGIFLYVGAEVAIGSLLVNYLNHVSGGSITEIQAGKYISIYWGGAMIGRFLGSLIMRYIKPEMVLMFFAIMAGLLVAVTSFGQGNIAIYSVLSIGFFNSIMFPTIFTISLEGLGERTSKGSGILCMAIVGGAIIPVVQGFFADKIGLQRAYLIPLLCYAYIAFLAFKHIKSAKLAIDEDDSNDNNVTETA